MADDVKDIKEDIKDEAKSEADDEYIDEPVPLESKAKDEGHSDEYLADDLDIEPASNSTSRKRRRVTNTDKNSYQVNNIQNELDQSLNLYNKMKDLKDDSGRLLSTEFINLPNGEFLPDYYTVIKKPISFQQIEARINNKEYVSMLEMKNDFELCFANAKKYNAKNSQIVVDAKFMLKKVKEWFQKFCEYGSVDGGPDPNESGFFFPQQKSKRGRPKGINKIVKKVIDKLMAHRDKDTGKLLSEPFNILPEEKEVPYYYDVIDNPMSFDIINKNMAEKFYTTISEIVEDMELMFNNAMHFNEEGSEIYNDARELKDIMYELLKMFVPDDMLDEKLFRIVMTPDGQRIPSTYVDVKPPPKTRPSFPLKAAPNFDISQYQSERSSIDPTNENFASQPLLKSHQQSPSATPSKIETQKKDEKDELILPIEARADSTHENKMLKMQPSLMAMKIGRSFVDLRYFVDHTLTIPFPTGINVEVKTYDKEDIKTEGRDILLRFNGSIIQFGSTTTCQPGEQNWLVTLQRKNVMEVFVRYRKSDDKIESTEMYRVFLSAGG
ncbi:hypothetical protein E3P81_01412 [Wallemia ichthyophaga]|nr:hypothetical protein E3P97_01413 [Wallemia ichthyophaga]TIB05595.1 hypothetical protein E3P96_01114 [Wallemia ichthyophaga]TIB33968.1 hypothetical protein E3P85_01054 [Wallemia ichthyophaga]TIB48250.1 hypothetical protein E3P82_01411 [Wallemia ichthyophaga]TIB52396.1 hypothetical protein E3P81_01412 [Wallemia ichthyophaga]